MKKKNITKLNIQKSQKLKEIKKKKNKKIPKKIPENPKNSLKKLKGQHFLKNPKTFLKNPKTKKNTLFFKSENFKELFFCQKKIIFS